jgi:hypothetical protein
MGVGAKREKNDQALAEDAARARTWARDRFPAAAYTGVFSPGM